MKKKVISIIMVATLAVLPLVGCTEQAGEAEAEVAYEVVGGISEPTRVWNEVSTDDVETEAPTEEAYEPTVYGMEPQLFVANKTAELLTSDKDWEVTGNVEEGTELTLIGYTGKGYYQTEDGYFISASDVEAKVEPKEEEKTQVAESNNTTTTTQDNNSKPVTQNNNTTTTESNNNGQSNEQPSQQTAEAPSQQEEQVPQPVQEEQTPTPAPEPTPAPQPTQEVPVTNTIVCGECGATFATDEECVAHLYAAHYDPNPEPSPVGCSHPNGYTDETGGFYCPDCGGYVSAH